MDHNEAIKALRVENVALAVVCAVLVGEICALHKNPQIKRDQILASLQGAISRLGPSIPMNGEAYDTSPATGIVETISTMAETLKFSS